MPGSEHHKLADTELLEAETVSITQRLIQIPSENDGVAENIGDGEAQAIALIESLLTEVGYECTVIEPVPGRPSLVARLAGVSPQAIVAHAHIDVVPATAADWTHPPFAGVIEDGFLWGRGAVDMKNMAGALVALARHYKRVGHTPSREIIFAFFADEEQGGTWGAKYLATHHSELFAGATHALSEVGGFSYRVGDTNVYPIATAEKGVAWLKLEASGSAGHGSRPTLDNAVAKITRAVARLADHQFPLVLTPALQEFLARMREITGLAFADNIESDLRELGDLGELVAATLRNTASPTILDAGYATNVIPTHARAELDCRILPGSEDSFAEDVSRIVGPDVSLEWNFINPIAANTHDDLVKKAQEAIVEQDPDALVVPYLLPASTDNKHLASLGIEGFGFTPLQVPADFDVFSQFHAVDERIPVSALEFSARVLCKLLS